MSARRFDPRFLLPQPDVRVAAYGGPAADPGWSRDDVAAGAAAPVLAVTDAAGLAEALAAAPPALLVADGRGTRRVRAAGYRTERWLALPDPTGPELLAPLDQPAVARYALRTYVFPAQGLKAVRNAALVTALGRVPLPRLPGQLVLATRGPQPPGLVTAARALLPAEDRTRTSGWLLLPGQGDGLSRGVLLLFRRGEAVPAYAVKYGRRPDRVEPFERDAAGLALVAQAGPVAACHAVRLLGRFEVGGHPASVETVGLGERLGRSLVRAGRPHGLALLQRIAGWTRELADATRVPGAGVPARVRALLSGLQGAAEAVSGLPSVLAHEDLGSWNVVVDGNGHFTVLDWESARADGLPLWDLLYLLLDGLALLDGATTHEERATHAVACAAGELAVSPVLHAAVRASLSALQLPPSSAGPLAALCWLHHAGSSARRGGGDAELPAAERIAERWLRHPGLGVHWPALAGAAA